MKKIFLITLAVMTAMCSVFYTSCKKTTHPTHPTPANNRILSYTKFSTSTVSGVAVNENFTFFYDGQKRVSQILYTTNDPVKVTAGAANEKISFTYASDTIYKTITAETSLILIERDTFIQNLTTGLITTAYTPGNINTFNYFGNLIAGTTKSVYDSGTVISATSTFTSDNGDLLIRSYDGTLHATYPDSGLIDLNSDGVLSTAFLIDTVNVFWTDLVTGKVTEHKLVDSYSDIFTGYTTGHPMAIQIYDTSLLALSPYIPVIAYDTCIWPGGIWPKENYYVYPDLLNRTGDYLQIESFTMYGVNIYQNAHMVKQIVEQNGPTTNATYTIDADSKVTQTYVTKVYPDTSTYTTVYKLQYETF